MAAAVNGAAALLHRSRLANEAMVTMLPADATVPADLALLIEGRYGGTRWLALSSALPLQDIEISSLTGGRPLDTLGPEMAALVIRLWLDKAVGEIPNFSIDRIDTSPDAAPDMSDLAVRLPLLISAPEWRAELLFMCESTTEAAGLAAKFVTPAQPRLPAELRVQISLSIGSVKVASGEIARLAPGDVIIFGELPQPSPELS